MSTSRLATTTTLLQEDNELQQPQKQQQRVRFSNEVKTEETKSKSRTKLNPLIPIFTSEKNWQRKIRQLCFTSLYFYFLYNVVKVIFLWFRDSLGWSEFHMIVTGIMLVHTVTFWSLNTLLTLVDVTKSPHVIYKYKIQHSTAVTWEEHLKCFKNVVFNQLCVLFPVTLLMFPVFQVTICSLNILFFIHIIDIAFEWLKFQTNTLRNYLRISFCNNSTL